MAVVVVSQGARRLLGVAGLSSPWLQVLAVTSVLVVASSLAELPFGLWRLAHERRWSFSRRTGRGWLADRLKGLALSLVLLDALALGFHAAVLSGAAWWLLAWAALSGLSVVLVMLSPAVLAPLFNKFHPLEDPVLVGATVDLGRRVGADIRQVLVMDASRRTAKHNAYFTGLGRTKRVVLWDTMLADYGQPATLAVLAHELGHWRRRHLPRMLARSSAVMLPAFAALRFLLDSPAVQRWAGERGAGDPAAVPLVAGAVMVMQVLWAPLAAWFSRAWERQADLDAVQLTGDAETYRSMQRDLAIKNLSDVSPSRFAYLLATHPPAPERMALAALAGAMISQHRALRG
ncbi:MAG: hypothetical protein NVSMB32_02560 [Actinomycetota bacterium]